MDHLEIGALLYHYSFVLLFPWPSGVWCVRTQMEDRVPCLDGQETEVVPPDQLEQNPISGLVRNAILLVAGHLEEEEEEEKKKKKTNDVTTPKMTSAETLAG